MALRSDWPASVAYYQNGDVAAWSTRFPYQVNPNAPARTNMFVDPTMFVLQTAVLPVELVANPPYVPQVWYGVKYRPTYTAQPPLPPPGGPIAPRAVSSY